MSFVIHRFSFYLSCFAIVTMTACASPVTPSPRPIALQASLRQPCPPLPDLPDGSAATALRWIGQAAKLYGECASRHRETVLAWPSEE